MGLPHLGLETGLCPLQLPASFFAYRKQQHRWTCGPVQLWRKTAYYIWRSNLPLHRKVAWVPLPRSQVGLVPRPTLHCLIASVCCSLTVIIDTAHRQCALAHFGSSAGRHSLLLLRHS